MATLTANDFATQMIAQLRVLDPSVSALVGTPERKIIDTVAQALAENQVDLTGLAGGLDVDSKYGSGLDRFTALFGFARQAAVAATGYVTFERNTAAPANIQVPAGATIQSNQTTANGQQLQYITTAGGTIAQGQTESGAVPVQCTVVGTQGNAQAAALTQLVGQNIPSGVTAVTNANPITNGANAEDDNSYKVRFKNTVFRNLAGTEDQYLALAVSTTYTTKANVIGPVSSYQEYVQVPEVDDAGFNGGVQYANGATLPNGVVVPLTNTGGLQSQWTTAPSAIPYARDIYTGINPFVSNGQQGIAQYFYRPGVDFIFNYPPTLVGDTYRQYLSGGQVVLPNTLVPNWTFLNVYNPSSGSAPTGLQSATPGGILLVEYSYLSAASRNSIQRNIYNAVDIYVDGANPTETSCVFLPGVQTFSTNPSSSTYFDNFRRDGEPAQRPHPGNFFTPLLNAPITSLPATITVGTQNYYLGTHYWLVHDMSLIGGSVRARDGIEWSSYQGADAGSQTPPAANSTTLNPSSAAYSPNVSLSPYLTTGSTVGALSASTTIEVDGYNYDANITVLQASLEKARQIATDVLAHKSRPRYFKLDVTVMYQPGVSPATVNVAVGTAVQAFMTNQFFGTVIQLSDLLDVIHQVPGVDNVRWTNDLPNPPTQFRVIECDINGVPLHTPTIDRTVGGTVSSVETQRLYIPGGQYATLGNPTSAFGSSDSFKLTFVDPGNSVNFTTTAITFDNLTAATIQTAIQANQPATGLYHGITVSPDAFVTKQNIASFLLTYPSNGTPYLPSLSSVSVTLSPFGYNSDYFLQDNELPSLPTGQLANDTVPGVIIRPRAQNTFVRPGIG
jgi:uncharacterized phage protein gp47/JayE